MTTEWQTIETAPRDETVLVWSEVDGPLMARADGSGWWTVVLDRYGTTAQEWNGGRCEPPFVFAPVTHWMPLPPPPD